MTTVTHTGSSPPQGTGFRRLNQPTWSGALAGAIKPEPKHSEAPLGHN